MSGSPLFIEVPAGAVIMLTPEAAATLEAALRRCRRADRASRNLAGEIESWLERNGLATGPEIARAIGARDSAVRDVLRADKRFSRATTPVDRSNRAKLWCLASSTCAVGPGAGTSTGNEGP